MFLSELMFTSVTVSSGILSALMDGSSLQLAIITSTFFGQDIFDFIPSPVAVNADGLRSEFSVMQGSFFTNVQILPLAVR